MKDKKLWVEEFPSDVKVDDLYDKVVDYLSSAEEDGFCPSMWDLAENPELMKLEEAPRCVETLSRFIPLLSEEKKQRLVTLANKARHESFESSYYCGADLIDEFNDPKLLGAISSFYDKRHEIALNFLSALRVDLSRS